MRPLQWKEKNSEILLQTDITVDDHFDSRFGSLSIRGSDNKTVKKKGIHTRSAYRFSCKKLLFLMIW